jgi:pimeloyl-ACP methyl ester carboxylesterase
VKAGVGICPAPPKGYKHAQISPIRQVRYIHNILFHIPFKPSYKLYRELFVSNLDEMSARKQYKMLQKQSSLVTYEVIKGKIPVDVSRTSCPLLFIATKDDAAIPPKVVQSMAQSFHASYQLYPGDHYIFNHWEDMAQGIFQFLQEKGN